MKRKVEPVPYVPKPKVAIPFESERNAWKNAKNRCLNPRSRDWKDYGGRGIAMHPAWINDFDSFLDHIGPKPSSTHSLDRIDNNSGYVPGNVRWATHLEQAKNKRKTCVDPQGNTVLAHLVQFDMYLGTVDELGVITLIPAEVIPIQEWI